LENIYKFGVVFKVVCGSMGYVGKKKDETAYDHPRTRMKSHIFNDVIVVSRYDHFQEII